MLESAIVRTILRKLNALPGCYARKTHGGPYSAGLPDVFACYQGHLLALEVKRPGGRLTPLQATELDRWRAAGATAAVVTSWAEVERILDELRAELPADVDDAQFERDTSRPG